MNKNILFCLSLILLFSAKAGAQDSFSVRAQRYVEQYYTMAMNEQVRSGIPASVTLAQGVLETEAGRSELACSANNHFGIKCKPDYQGDKFFHDDDAPKECFKMYKCAEDSYKDHSDYLKRNQRYSPLFAISQTDYASWAICLRKCGYATNPQYAQRLIKIIEDFKLQKYTYAAMDSSFMPQQPLNVKNAVALKDVPKKPVAVAVPDTSRRIVLTTFDEPTVPAKTKKIAAATTAQPPVKEAIVPVADVPKVVEVAKVDPKPSASFSQIKALADSTHHILANDGPQTLQSRNAPAADTQIAATTPKAAQPNQASIDTKYDSGKVISVNGLKAFYAYKGEMLLQYAVKYNVRYPHLLEINDLEDKPLESNMPVYLEKKLTTGTHAKHTVKEGENMFLIAQAEGLQLKRLLALNMMDIGDEPATGVILELQNGVFRKPTLRAVVAEAKSNTTTMLGKSTPPGDYITKPVVKPVVKLPETVKEKPKEVTATQQYVETMPAAKASATDTIEEVEVAAEGTTGTLPTAKAVVNEDAGPDELAALKAELDKVVYTDDSKLISTRGAVASTRPMAVKPTITRPEIKKPEVKKPEVKKPAKGKGKKDDDDDDDEEGNKKGSNYYTIKNGETLGGIANRHNTTVKKLMQLNRIKDVDIRAGKKLRVK